ncbi:MAG: GTPase HflX [Defluviitaleaceae bacterium]|nr:GTPase HflX [Defluviitaleaceae bacterium]
MYDIHDYEELAVLVALDEDHSSLDELAELVRTAGGREVGRLTQKREAPHRGHYIGKGKLEELAGLVSLTGATAIVCDDELTSTQQRGLAEALDVKILDRTMIILDIFAAHASTSEGKLQVELAQLGYTLSHLSGIGKQLSRLGGGIGTRGPGEKKLETDRRHIRTRMDQLRHEIDNALSHREVARKARKRAQLPSVAIVGYTNAGKSTLMNALADAGVAAQDKLFMTLDTTTRTIKLSTGLQVLISDTVGFIRKLPHKLVDAFRATLEELAHADILLHVIDASNPDRDRHIAVVTKTLQELGLGAKPIICVLNKVDALPGQPLPPAEASAHIAVPVENRPVRRRIFRVGLGNDNDACPLGTLGGVDDAIREKDKPDGMVFNRNSYTVRVSALTGFGLDSLITAIESAVNSRHRWLRVLVPYTEGALIARIYETAQIHLCEEGDAGFTFEIHANEELTNRLANYTFC